MFLFVTKLLYSFFVLYNLRFSRLSDSGTVEQTNTIKDIYSVRACQEKSFQSLVMETITRQKRKKYCNI